MSNWRLKSGESVRDAVRRVARHELDRALALLRRGGRTSGSVHDARKCGKRLRSLLRLLRPALGERVFARENAALRDAMRVLGPVRDAEALLEATGELRAKRASPGALQHLRAELRQHFTHVLRTAGVAALMARAARTVSGVRSHAAKWSPAGGGWSMLEPGLRKVYRRARSAARDLGDDPASEDLHEWRKRAKNLQHTLELLADVWPKGAKSLAKDADSLCDDLGDDRDLARLQALAQAKPTLFGAPAARTAMLARIAARRRDLLAHARALGDRLLADKPASFVRRFHSHWHRWRRVDR